MTWFSRARRKGPTPPRARHTLDVAVLTDRGLVRPQNEDTGRYVRPGDAATRQTRGVLVLVADGMGGHAAGEVASTRAAETIAQHYYDTEGVPPADALRDAFLEANQAIYETALYNTALRGMGTTCTALVLREPTGGEGEAVMAHVGDSRLYLCREQLVHRLSEDHTVVAELVRRGFLTPEEARHHEHRHVITRAMGTRPDLEVALWARPLRVQVGDIFILASDGLHDLVEDEEIGRAVARADAHTAASHLIDLAKERGGHDNITVGVARVLPAEPSSTSAHSTSTTRELPTLS